MENIKNIHIIIPANLYRRRLPVSLKQTPNVQLSTLPSHGYAYSRAFTKDRGSLTFLKVIFVLLLRQKYLHFINHGKISISYHQYLLVKKNDKIVY